MHRPALIVERNDHKVFAWEKEVGRIIHKYASLSILDVPGESLVTYFCDGLSPKNAAIAILDDEGSPPTHG